MAAVGGGRPTTSWCCSPRHLCLQFAVVLLLVSTLSTARGNDTLQRGDAICCNETLVSAGGVFELGIFSPPDSSNNCYVGMWYKNITVRTVVWVANRDTPMSDCSGALAVDPFGSVRIQDWSGNVVQELVEGANQVTLLDSGNLVVTAAGSNQTVWQSFNYPTDTWLPGMRLGRNRNLIKRLTSWRSSADPRPGDFTLEADGRRLIVSQKGTRQYWFIGGLGLEPASNPWSAYDDIRNFTYNATYNGRTVDVESYFVYAAASPFTRLVLAPQGQLQLQTWASPNWTVLWAEPQKCNITAYCGANGLCNSGGSPTCKCLPGFDPRSPSSWTEGRWSDGCSRRLPTKCAGDGFSRLQGVRQPSGN